MTRTAILAALALAAACGGSESEPSYTITDTELTFETGEFEVGVGDVFECFYTDVITDRELAIRGAGGQQSLGGHHVTIYYTSIIKDPQHHPCDSAEMADWRMVGGGGDEAEAAVSKLRLPDGLATRVPAGVQIVLQSHYINLEEAPYTANDTATIELVPVDTVEDYVNQFVVNDVGFSVPPHEDLESVSTCTVPEDLSLIRLLGHMHEWGTRYKLERLGEEDAVEEVLIDREWEALYVSDPIIEEFPVDDPLLLPAGTRLRQTCSWFNDGEDALLFPREMCIAFSLYLPDRGEVFCEMD